MHAGGFLFFLFIQLDTILDILVSLAKQNGGTFTEIFLNANF